MAENKKKIVTITEEVKELIFDIQNKTYLIGQSHESDGKNKYESASDIQISDEEDKLYQVRCSLSSALSSMKVLLCEYLSEEINTSDNLIQNEIESEKQLILILKLPQNYNDSSIESLSKGIHSYLVDMSLADWFSIVDIEKAEAYRKSAVENWRMVKSALYMRKRPKRPV